MVFAHNGAYVQDYVGDSRDTCMEIGGTAPWKGDDYKDVEGRERLEHVLEVEPRQEQRSRVETGAETDNV